MAVVRAPDVAPANRGSDPYARSREQSRARYPDETGFVERDGVRVAWERYGDGAPTILLVPTWSIIHSRIWKAQIPYLARHHRVVTFDARGNGRSDRPLNAEAYSEWEMAADVLAVMAATETDEAILVSLSLGAQRAVIVAAEHPERVAGLVCLGPAVPLVEGLPERNAPFDERLESDDGWARYNRHAWRRDYVGFLDFFMAQCFTEPHSTKQIEDAVDWGLDTDPEILILTHDAPSLDESTTRGLCAAVRCPALIIQGDADAVTGAASGLALAEAIPAARLVTVAGSGHIPNGRDPVLVNLLLRDFVRGLGVAP